jgi:hypothetical protein
MVRRGRGEGFTTLVRVTRVYASLPLTGPVTGLGREVLRGAELALEAANEAAVELLAVDSFGDDREERAIVNARRAVEDVKSLAYLGDFHSSQVMETARSSGRPGFYRLRRSPPSSDCTGPRSSGSCRTTGSARGR